MLGEVVKIRTVNPSQSGFREKRTMTGKKLQVTQNVSFPSEMIVSLKFPTCKLAH